MQAGLLLGPGGEFGFVMLSLATQEGLLPQSVTDTALIAVALSMAAIPLLSAFGRRHAPPASRAAPRWTRRCCRLGMPAHKGG